MDPKSDATQNAQTPADFGPGPAGEASRWISELTLAEKDHKRFRNEARKVIKDYEAFGPGGGEVDTSATLDQTTSGTKRYALLWSNQETLQPAVQSRAPQAVVARRWKDADPLARIVSEILERCLNFAIDATDYADTANGVRNDFLLVGRGVAWVRYCPHYTGGDQVGDQVGVQRSSLDADTKDGPEAESGPSDADSPPAGTDGGVAVQGGDPDPDGQITDDGQGAFLDLGWQEVIWDHVSWDDFLHNPARKWAEVRWVARCAYMTRDELIKRFGAEKGKACPLDHTTPDSAARDGDPDEQFGKAAVWEIWDIVSRKAVWINKSLATTPLDEKPDPLGLKDFFPCPRPPMATRSPRSVLPIPDYHYYRKQADQIDELTARIGKLMDGLKLIGFYSAGGEQKDALADVLDGPSNRMVPIDSWAAFAEKGGVKGIVEWLPLDMVVSTLDGLIKSRALLIEDADRLSGVADIQRGAVDPDETATATNTKANWGTLRVRNKQKEMARFARDCLRLAGEVIAKQFEAKTLGAMSNIDLFDTPEAKQMAVQQLQAQAQQTAQAAQMAQQQGQPAPPPFQPDPKIIEKLGKPTWAEVLDLLRSNDLRSFRIDIETDSTIEPDDQEEKARRVEFVEAVGGLIEKMLPLMQIAPQMLPVAAQSLLYLVRGFRVGREMEDVIEKAMEQLGQAAGQPQPQQNGPNPQAEQMKAQAANTNAQANMVKAQAATGHLQVEQAKVQSQHQIGMAQIGAENARTQADAHLDVHMQQQDIAAQLQQAVLKSTEKRLVHDINDSSPIKAGTS